MSAQPARPLYSPFDLRIEPMERLLLIPFAKGADEVSVSLTPSGGWRPNERKWSLRLMYRLLPAFTQWPKTYEWTATAFTWATPSALSAHCSCCTSSA